MPQAPDSDRTKNLLTALSHPPAEDELVAVMASRIEDQVNFEQYKLMDKLVERMLAPPWGWFKTIAYELSILRRNNGLVPVTGLPEPTLEEIFWFFFSLTVMLWTTIGRPIDEAFVLNFTNGELRLACQA